jgi:hypothetical protein
MLFKERAKFFLEAEFAMMSLLVGNASRHSFEI